MKLKDILKVSVREGAKMYSEEEQFLVEEAVLIAEILNPNESFKYDGERGTYYYYDSTKNMFFIRLAYQPTKTPHFELKTGWFEDNNPKKPRYEPSLPNNVSIKDTNIRGNTLAKIYRDEIIPFFNSQNLTDLIIVKPMSISRYKFSVRMIQKFTPKKMTVNENPKSMTVTITK